MNRNLKLKLCEFDAHQNDCCQIKLPTCWIFKMLENKATNNHIVTYLAVISMAVEQNQAVIDLDARSVARVLDTKPNLLMAYLQALQGMGLVELIHSDSVAVGQSKYQK